MNYAYCLKCGNVTLIETKNERCEYCKSKLHITPYTMEEYLFGNSIECDIDTKIFNEYIKDNPEFDEELYAQREGKEKILQQASLDRQINANIPKCPTCQSTKIKKISDLKKATGFMMVGIFSSNFGKTMECENCGYKW